MHRRTSRTWKFLIIAAVIGIVAGAVYYVGMRQRVAPAEFVNFLTDSGDDDLSSAFVPTPIITRESIVAAPNADYARLSIPTAGVSALIVQLQITGNSWGVHGLGRNVGYLIGTAPVMGSGNTVLVGHVEMGDGTPGVFARIPNMNLGEPIFLNWRGEQREYRVASVETVSPDDVSVLYPSSHDLLTLITCSDYSFFDNAYLQRVVVIASRVT